MCVATLNNVERTLGKVINEEFKISEIATKKIQPEREIPVGDPRGQGYGSNPKITLYSGAIEYSYCQNRPISYQVTKESNRRLCI